MIALTFVTDRGKTVHVAEAHIVAVTDYFYTTDPDTPPGSQVELSSGGTLIVIESPEDIVAAIGP